MKISVSFLVLVFSISVFASYDQILDVAEKYNSQKKSVTGLEAEKRKVLGLLYKIEKESSSIARDKTRLKNDERSLEKDLVKVSKEIVALEDSLSGIAKVLHSRWDMLKKIQDVPWLYIFLSAETPAELEKTEYLFNSLNKKEMKMASSYLKSLQELQKKKIDLNRLALELVVVRRDLKEKEKTLKVQHLVKKKMIGSLESKIKSKKRSLQLTQNLGKRLSSKKELNEFSLLFATSFFDKKGQLPHPTKGPVVHEYGFNKAFSGPFVQLLHKGNFYKVKKGTAIKTVAPGRISFYDTIEGLGLLLVIDHGSNYYTIYSNLSKKTKKISDIVQSGEVIGFSGSGNFQFNEGLYFEIRHFAEPENPKDWLKKRNNIEDLATSFTTKEGDT